MIKAFIYFFMMGLLIGGLGGFILGDSRPTVIEEERTNIQIIRAEYVSVTGPEKFDIAVNENKDETK